MAVWLRHDGCSSRGRSYGRVVGPRFRVDDVCFAALSWVRRREDDDRRASCVAGAVLGLAKTSTVRGCGIRWGDGRDGGPVDAGWFEVACNQGMQRYDEPEEQ